MEPIPFSFDQPLFLIGTLPVTAGHLVTTAALLVVLFSAIMVRRARSARATGGEEQMSALIAAQTEMQGRIAAMTEVLGARQAELNQSLSQRIDGMTHRIGASISEQTKATHENLRRLQERLAVIDNAQNNIQSLAKDMAGLQSILANKQTRGAFGQSRMEAIVADGLPMGAFAFQATLSNGARPDCTIRMPNGQPPLVIDAKFPLEAWNSMRDAASAERRQQAAQAFRRDMEVHIRDIAGKYLLPGETQDTAFLFVPSESIFAEIHEHFEAVVQKAHRQRIVIVSPSLLLLSIQVIQAILKDARMREQAHLIQGEVVRLMEDLSRLDERVRKLQGHFAMTQKDVEDILISSDKLTRRGAKIEALELQAEADPRQCEKPGDGSGRPMDGRMGQLKLRVVDED
ncbi:DNA recombination protein RmuC [Sinorhizobium meliloti WSM1022]|jgi:DNA recombination protein RmuC|uniref:DNA recombination protein RmuC n=1 Tax=Rhizobium meliloti TaxID=382 RepID=UPI00041A9F30|nr:DNA recombination protein RmuC [Sinorhizobium meliloti]ASQ05220.1 DNA recombination protein RmuC [Sinorhizobium meliloti]MCO6423291.1 DNA recombination protein RmuC [Sinorhizobium meliloti]MDW9407839.1 DNA recombination protein RmuC [Sinorhizobium meliloti]MDW9439869.1 DNA recombination protein RmuC [Sinorhizobium meliloti]MDW9456544.1 DNA recombination protein RmuC [Sinorhizobium meliloti]